MQEVFVFPLSFAQERLWFLDRLVPGNPFYNTLVPMRLAGSLGVGALLASLREVTRRHESLRTTFALVEGRPHQLVAAARTALFPVVDLRALPPGAREAEASRQAAAEAGRPFDLRRGPLLRTLLLTLGGDRAVLLLCTHHIVSDAWSMRILLDEMAALYAAFVAGRPSPLREPALQYADFAVWQRKWLRGEVLAAQLGYWRRQLTEPPLTPLALPADRPRPAVASFRGASQPVRLRAEAATELRAVGQRAGATLYMTALAAFALLLGRWSGQDDVVVGTPIANRNRAEVERLIGFFVNSLVLRARLGGGETRFRELLAQVRETALGAFAHQDLPFEMLVEELQPARDLSRNPLFQVTFQVQSVEGLDFRLPGVEISYPRVANRTAKFDLAVDLWEGPQGLNGRIEYSSDLFDPSTVARLAGHLETLLAAAAAAPEAGIFDLPVLRDAERKELARWCGAGPSLDEETAGTGPCLHQLIAAQAARTPEAPAIVDAGGSTVSYRELARRVERLARRLRVAGAGPETPVAVCLERSPELIVALLAVLAAGGAYLPLDPEHPASRQAFLVRDAGAVLILTARRLRRRLPGGGPPMLAIEEVEADAGSDAQDEAGAPAPSAGGEWTPVLSSNLAYVLYTSGSTGQPKGVLIEHGSLARYVSWAARALLSGDAGGGEELALPALASPAFDASLKQLFAPLVAGGTVWLLPPAASREPAQIVAALADRTAVALNVVPSLWEVLLDRLTPAPAATARTLRRLLLGGEPLRPELVRRTAAALPGAEIWNLYGPTEATANAIAGRVGPGGPGDEVALGRPLPGVRIAVLGKGGEPVPAGVEGELHIGGEGLARGYLGRPDLTAERFLPDPDAAVPGGRRFRTGDRVRFTRDGALCFLGRADAQLKVNGFRIEPGEVEAAIGRHPAVAACAVEARDLRPGEPRLIAYLVWRNGRDGLPPGAEELRAFAGRELPDYMVPAVYVPLPALPLTRTGKLDRSALPGPAGGRLRAGAGRARKAPRTALERQIAAVWREVLELESVGNHDNFFDLGGRSLLLARVHGRLVPLLDRRLSMIDLFRYPTIGALAAHLARQGPPDGRGGPGARQRRVALQRGGR